MPVCPWCDRRVWLWQSNLYGGPCSRCWRAEALGREMAARGSDGSLTDPRLEGTWRSDATRTIEEWRQRRPLRDEQAEGLKQLFGHLRVTFTGQRVRYDFSQWTQLGANRDPEGGRYAVVARDSTSVVLLTPKPDSEELGLVHLRFCCPDVYWLHVELAPMREYFVREPPAEPEQ